MTPLTIERAMEIALEEAALAAAAGDVPVGAVLLDEHGHELARGRNEREVTGDPTAHAEVVVIRRAAAAAGHWRLERTTLVVTLEPCAMCAGAIVSSRIAKVVFGTRDPKAGAVRSLYRIADDARLNHRVSVDEGPMRDDCARVLRDFFAKLRSEGQK